MKNTKISRNNTFAKDGIENKIVYKIAYRPSALPANLASLVTLSTLISLANYGPFAKIPLD